MEENGAAVSSAGEPTTKPEVIANLPRKPSVGEPRTVSDDPPTKRLKTAPATSHHASTPSTAQPKTPDIASEVGVASAPRPPEVASMPPNTHAQRSGSVSDLSSSSAATLERHDTLSPIPTLYSREVPPAPPSTPASHSSAFSWDGSSTPLPIRAPVLNANTLEEQQKQLLLLAEGAATPAPTKPTTTTANATSSTAPTDDRRAKAPAASTLPEDFSDWAVGDRYKMVRILGRGSYGEVAQALDLFANRPDAYVAIKRIQSPFDQEVDAIRLYREIHILRRMRGHDCIIQLLDVVQPPTDDLDDFHDLYLVFECKLNVVAGLSSHNIYRKAFDLSNPTRLSVSRFCRCGY